jgi:hypothetical protein
MANLRKVQYTLFGFLAFYMITGIGALVLANIWLSSEPAPREAVISREIERGTLFFIFIRILDQSLAVPESECY